MTCLRIPVVLFSLLAGGVAHAHIQLETPTARGAAQKQGPCGARNSTRGEEVNDFEPGETITVQWRETVNHPSHYRISFDADGDDDFRDPTGYMDFAGNPTVLVDAIEDTGGTLSIEVTLPDVECETCTLQVIQVMYDKPPYGDGNDMYYQCADLALRRAPGAPDVPTAVDDAEPVDAGVLVDAAGTFDTGDPAMADVGVAVDVSAEVDPSVVSRTTNDDDDGGCQTSPGRSANSLLWLVGSLITARFARSPARPPRSRRPRPRPPGSRAPTSPTLPAA